MAWQPLQNIGPVSNPKLQERYEQIGIGADEKKHQSVWVNDLYEVIATTHELDPLGVVHLSIKRYDRLPVREWRHLQQIKNEIVGPEAEAFEMFPAESKLVDTANQYHLWCVPPQEDMVEGEKAAVLVLPMDGGYMVIGYNERLVSSDEQVEKYNEGREKGDHNGRQQEWEEGLTTGAGRNENPDPRLDKLMD